MEWKDHPVIIASAAAAAAMVFYAQVLQPIATKDKDNTIADQTKKIAELNQRIGSLNSAVAAAAASQAEATKTMEATVARNAALSQADMFSPDLPYPKGLRAFKVGDRYSTDAIRTEYPSCTVKESETGWASVDCSKSGEFFSKVTYFSNDAPGNGAQVVRVSYQYKDIGDKSQALTVSQLKDIVGTARLISDGDISKWWTVKNYEGLNLRISPIGYEVMRKEILF